MYGGHMIRTYRDLLVWQKAMDLAVELYRLTRTFPASERFGLISQIQRAGASIPSNIAEGHSRNTRGDYRRGISIARGSVGELETHLELARRLGYVQQDNYREFSERVAEIGRMLTTLSKRLSSKQP
jgi:four helix bundle protein